MSGIILLLILAIWFYIVKKLSGFCLMKMQDGTKKTVVHSVLFGLMFIAPVTDEIIGGFQFRALCESEKLLIYNPEKIEGKSVVSKIIPAKPINKTVLPIVVTAIQWEDEVTGEVLITRKIYYAKGGLLSRLLGGYPDGKPYTFGGGCGPKEPFNSVFEKFNIQVL